jgi:hypothetical protein
VIQVLTHKYLEIVDEVVDGGGQESGDEDPVENGRLVLIQPPRQTLNNILITGHHKQVNNAGAKFVLTKTVKYRSMSADLLPICQIHKHVLV